MTPKMSQVYQDSANNRVVVMTATDESVSFRYLESDKIVTIGSEAFIRDYKLDEIQWF